MKVYITTKSNPALFLTILGVLGGFSEEDKTNSKYQRVPTEDETDTIMCSSIEEARELYAKYGNKKFLVFFNFDTIPTPEDNVFCITQKKFNKGGLKLAAELVAKYEEWVTTLQQTIKQGERQQPDLGPVVTLAESHLVLVVDDNPAHLNTAMQRLVCQQLLVANSAKQALEFLKMNDQSQSGGQIEAVLTDLNMTPDKMYPSLNTSQYGLSETVPAGIAIMFEATKRGIPCAVVTDANYHQDFFSAMFSNMKETSVNGVRVHFHRENGGKRWDYALSKLLE